MYGAGSISESSAKILAHRTGCRCKKSNCMKKVRFDDAALLYFWMFNCIRTCS
jgi:hypothetical protein